MNLEKFPLVVERVVLPALRQEYLPAGTTQGLLRLPFNLILDAFRFLDRETSQWVRLQLVCKVWHTKAHRNCRWVGLLQPRCFSLTKLLSVCALPGLRYLSVVDTNFHVSELED